MVSLKDIASKCDVSIATVSKALNGHADISEITRDLVRREAKAMGYFPNSSARALKTKKTYNIGVVFDDEAHSGFTHEYFASVLQSVKETAGNHGYDITFINKHMGEQLMCYYEHSRYRGVDGVVIACVDFDDPDVLALVKSELPVVTIDHTFDNKTAIISDNIRGMEELVKYIYSQGHEKIAYIHGTESAVTRNRLGSFYRTMEELGIEVNEDYIKAGHYHDSDSAALYTKELLQLKEQPTCIIYPDDFSSLGGMNVIKSYGLRIPDDISIVGYDGILLSQTLEPKITTFMQNTYDMGKCATEKLIAIIEHPKTTVIDRVVVEGRLLKGASVKKMN